jgi:hypothetical protein
MNILEVTPEMCTETHVNLHIKCLLPLSDFSQNLMCQQVLIKLHNIKFHENQFSSYWLLHADRWADTE